MYDFNSLVLKIMKADRTYSRYYGRMCRNDSWAEATNARFIANLVLEFRKFLPACEKTKYKARVQCGFHHYHDHAERSPNPSLAPVSAANFLPRPA